MIDYACSKISRFYLFIIHQTFVAAAINIHRVYIVLIQNIKLQFRFRSVLD